MKTEGKTYYILKEKGGFAIIVVKPEDKEAFAKAHGAEAVAQADTLAGVLAAFSNSR